MPPNNAKKSIISSYSNFITIIIIIVMIKTKRKQDTPYHIIQKIP